ncbi:MAG: PAS domain S-box protein [Crenarchaeota archaeon]|nr:PAS domain S-box protein [Thermoproteota archaeon]
MGTASSLKRLNLDISAFEELLFDHSIVSVTNETGNIVYANKKFCKISKYSGEELIGQNHSLLKSDEHAPKFFT